MRQPVVRPGSRFPRILPGAVMALAFAAALALAAAWPAAPTRAESQAPPPLGLEYGLFVGGLQALDVSTRVDLRESGYDIRFQARTDGFIGRLFPFVIEARTGGARADGRLRPARYATANRWGDNGKRWVSMRYAGDGGSDESAPEIAAEPPSDEDDRDVVPEAARLGTVDPVSAIYGLVLDSEDGCSGRRAVFDGRRRYDIVAEDRGEGTVPPSSYAVYDGPARLCRLTIEKVDGFWTKYDMKRRYPDTVDVWLAKVARDLPALPVRLEAETLIGALRVHLTGVQRGRAAELPASGLFPLEEARSGR